MKYRFAISGMGCMKCVKKVTDALTAAGAENVTVEIGSAEAGFEGDAAVLSAAIAEKGFEVTAVTVLD